MYYYSDLYSNLTIANLDSRQDYADCGLNSARRSFDPVSAGGYETTPDILMLS